MPKPRKSFVSQSLLVLFFVGMTTLSYPLAATETDDGNWRIVNYCSKWCAPCRVEIPLFIELSVRPANRTVVIVDVNFDEDLRELTLDIADYRSGRELSVCDLD